MRPGRGRICRIERAATLLPQPLSPTTPRVSPRLRRSVDASHRPDGALAGRTRSLRFLDLEQRRHRLLVMPSAVAVGVGGVAQTVAEEVERQHRDDDGDAPGSRSQGAVAMARMFWASCSSTPQLIAGGAGRGRGSSGPSRPGSSRGSARRHRGDDVADEGGHHVAEMMRGSLGAVELARPSRNPPRAATGTGRAPPGRDPVQPIRRG